MADDCKTKDEALQAASMQHEALLAHMRAGYARHEMIFDDEGRPIDYRFLEVNQAFERLTGLKGADIVGKTVLEALPGTESSWIERYAKVVETGETAYFDDYSKELDSYFEVTAFRPAPNQFVAVFTDVSQYKKNVIELRGRTVALEQSLDGICIANLDGKVIFVNEAWAELHKWPLEDLVGEHISLFHTAEQMETLVGPLFESIKDNGFHMGVVDHVTKDGREFPTRMSNTLIHDEDDNPVGVIAIAHDISAERKLEEGLRQAQKMEAVGTLAGGIAHEFNNILYAIIGFADLIESTLAPEHESKEFIAELQKAAERARKLVARILAFSSGEAGDNQPFSVVKEVTEALELLKSTTPSSIQVVDRLLAKSELIWGDAFKFRQAFINVCTNAIQAMDNGGELEIFLDKCTLSDSCDEVSELQPGAYVKLSVSDSGPGMDFETKRRIFDPFFTTKDVGKGSGLGLSTVHGNIKSMKGAVTVDSKPGKGSSFHIYLPCYRAEKRAEPILGTAVGGDENLLLVDDEELIVQAIGRRLRKLGYEVRAEKSPLKALDFYHEHAEEVDLVITDLTMPKMSGLELVEEIRKINIDVPIVLCTGYGEAALDKSAKNNNCEVIMKPIAVRDLSLIIRRLLDEQKGEKE